MSDPASPIDELLEAARAALLARRRDAALRIDRVEAALAAYRRAAEHQLATEFAAEHRLRAPARVGAPLVRAAEELRDAVLALPEIARLSASDPESARPGAVVEAATEAESHEAAPVSSYPALTAALSTQKLVIIGALHRDRSDAVPPALAPQVEWVDTERDGVHALGNLPQRIRHGRVAAVVILDRAVKHKHSEPALAAARDAHVPTAFAGQGGRASLERAFAQIESALSRR